jgi:hypothetical protein
MKKAIAIFAALALLASCASLDIIGKHCAVSFFVLTNTLKLDSGEDGWRLEAPDGTSSFYWNPAEEIEMRISAVPFVLAGMDYEMLESDFALDDGSLFIRKKLGDGVSKEPDMQGSFRHIVRAYPEAISYHASMGHFNISLGGGNLFEWAQDLKTFVDTGKEQDKDMVFALNPEPFIAAGVNPNEVEGWDYAQVEMHMDGKPTKVWKFIKAFNII